MSKKIKLDYKDLFVNLAKMIIIGCVSCVLCYITAIFTEISLSGLSIWLIELIKIVAVSMVLAVSYLSLSLIFKVGYVGEIKNRILKKLGK